MTHKDTYVDAGPGIILGGLAIILCAIGRALWPKVDDNLAELDPE